MQVSFSNNFLAALSAVFVLFVASSAMAQTAPTCTLTANPYSVIPGQGFTLSLSSSGATSAFINNSIGSIPVNGSKSSISIAQTTTFTAAVYGAGGTSTCETTVTTNNGGSSSGGGGGGGANPLQTAMGLLQAGAGLMQLQSALGGSNSANAMCTPVDTRCPCGKRMTNDGCKAGGNMHLCTCAGTVNGVQIAGYCELQGKCRATAVSGGLGGAGGAGGGLAGGLQGLASILQGIQSLTGGAGGGGGGGTGGTGVYPTGCTQYYYTSSTTTDPCAIYQPNFIPANTTIQTGLSDALFNAIGSGTSSLSSLFTNLNTNTNTSTNTNTNTGMSSLLNQISPNNQNSQSVSGSNAGQLKDSLTGDVRLGGAGATVYANLKQGLTEVAGFFGGNTFGGQNSQSALSRVCAARPWASSNFLASITPDSFFDNLCRRAGYQVGQVTETQRAQQNTSSFTSSTNTTPVPTATTTGPYIPPEADIRAEPSSVRLGTRTYIFWTSKGVSSCAVAGPSFTQNTLSGAGATVPITGPTTFTIECIATASTTVRDSVTVNLAI